MNDTRTRQESDFLGTVELPGDAYWGIQTQRAMDNFAITGTPVGQWRSLVCSLGQVKKACAQANMALGVLDLRRGAAIVAACDDVIAGYLDGEFLVDVVQGGAGTSTNMNANEVIANQALVRLGVARGRYDEVHPNDHVNASQSTNDVYPTALRLALWQDLARLLDALAALRQSFERKGTSFASILKIGRTQLQDAVPMTLGQEFTAYAVTLSREERRLREARAALDEVNLGATAIGTGINAPHGFAALVVQQLSQVCGRPLASASDLFEATQDTGAFVQLSGSLKQLACKLGKICNDLRLLSSGPQCGFGDLRLPPRQAGSSIMPGKVNPVIPEVVNQVAFEVIGNDLTVTMASEAGQLQLNAFEPLIGWTVHKSIVHLASACSTLGARCIDGIEPNLPHLARRVAESATVATALSPIIGYESAAMLAQQVLAKGGTVASLAQAMGIVSSERAAILLQPETLAHAAESSTRRSREHMP
jgi:aspartate ammonia-lyase